MGSFQDLLRTLKNRQNFGEVGVGGRLFCKLGGETPPDQLQSRDGSLRARVQPCVYTS